ncbi:MAG: peptidoglycan editing factor PgeF [Kofleriaceae bacterium]|nr:peptidoglycan editing factor PgeF [Kofleriaceae bacterium]
MTAPATQPASSIRLHRSHVLPTEGFTHGFPERVGGVSQGLRSSLNLGVRWGDDKEHVETNRRLLAVHAGYDHAQLQVTRHVHGTNVWRVGEPLAEGAEFDGLVCDRVGPVLGAFAADCIPILFAEPEARVCGAAHAGWRGTVAGVARNVVTRMVELGARADRLRVALGPSIGPECFEVGTEVVDEFRAAFGDLPGLVVQGPRKDHIDLRVATRAVLERVGVRPEHIDDRPPCTRCEPERFFSYRRDGKDGGVHMAFIGLT